MLGLRRRLIFPRHVCQPADNIFPSLRGAKRWARSLGRGEVEAWFLPAHHVDELTADESTPLVVFAHGNGELIEQWPHALKPYLQLGCSLLLPEYRGYGRSAGWPSEAAIVDDYAWFLERVLAQAPVDPQRVVFHGRSLGGGVVSQLATRHKPQALILWSTFTSVDAVAKRFGAPAWLVPDHFRSDHALASLGVPTLVAHGRDDSLIPVAHAHALAKLTDAKLLLYDAGHNDCPPAHSEYWPQATRFLREAGIIDQPACSEPAR